VIAFEIRDQRKRSARYIVAPHNHHITGWDMTNTLDVLIARLDTTHPMERSQAVLQFQPGSSTMTMPLPCWQTSSSLTQSGLPQTATFQ
jgi:hypothetical protein